MLYMKSIYHYYIDDFDLLGCKTKPFVKHALEFEKIADNCNPMLQSAISR